MAKMEISGYDVQWRDIYPFVDLFSAFVIISVLFFSLFFFLFAAVSPYSIPRSCQLRNCIMLFLSLFSCLMFRALYTMIHVSEILVLLGDMI